MTGGAGDGGRFARGLPRRGLHRGVERVVIAIISRADVEPRLAVGGRPRRRAAPAVTVVAGDAERRGDGGHVGQRRLGAPPAGACGGQAARRACASTPRRRHMRPGRVVSAGLAVLRVSLSLDVAILTRPARTILSAIDRHDDPDRRLPRRPVALGAAAFAALFSRHRCGAAPPHRALAAQSAADPCAGSRDLRLTNGKIATMDARGTTVARGDHPERPLHRRGPARRPAPQPVHARPSTWAAARSSRA